MYVDVTETRPLTAGAIGYLGELYVDTNQPVGVLCSPATHTLYI